MMLGPSFPLLSFINNAVEPREKHSPSASVKGGVAELDGAAREAREEITGRRRHSTDTQRPAADRRRRPEEDPAAFRRFRVRPRQGCGGWHASAAGGPPDIAEGRPGALRSRERPPADKGAQVRSNMSAEEPPSAFLLPVEPCQFAGSFFALHEGAFHPRAVVPSAPLCVFRVTAAGRKKKAGFATSPLRFPVAHGRPRA